MALFPSTAIASAAGGYDVSYSCRFSEANKHYLYRTISSAGNRKTWTLSFWYKKGNSTSAHQYWFAADNNGEIYLRGTGDEIGFQHIGDGSAQWKLPKEKSRDTTGWIHILFACDTTQSTDTERFKYYVNGVRTTPANISAGPWGTGTWPSQNSENDVNNNVVHSIGWKTVANQTSFDGYMAEHIFIDGLALTPTDFGEFNDYGGWSPIDPSGLTFGSNGWYLNFANASDLGNDVSGNNNDFTLSTISSHDQTLDTPSNNFPTVNYLDNYWYGTTFAEGHLKITTGGGGIEPTNIATMGVNSGKWYWEIYCGSMGSGDDYALLGISGQQGQDANDNPGRFADGYAWYSYGQSGNIINNNGYTSYGSSTGYDSGDVISIALDLVNNKCYWAKNNTWLNSGNPAGNSNGYSISANPTSGHYFPSFGDFGAYGCTFTINFGQEGTFVGSTSAGNNQDGEGIGNFKYAPPSGFLALCAKNLPEPAVIPSEHFKTVLYTGNGGTQSITGVGFQPDLVWIKSRSSGYSHGVFDSVRGATQRLNSDNNSLEETTSNSLTAFGADGFSVGNHAANNTNSALHVAWCWKAGGTGSSNTAGSINTTSTSVNTAAGFSIGTYTGVGDGSSTVSTIGHGLSKTPELVIVKRRNVSGMKWTVGAIEPLGGMDATDALFLDTDNSLYDENYFWNDTAPTSSVVTVMAGSYVNTNGGTYVMYCWHSVEGYSKVGSYCANGNTNGVFVYMGFRPAFMILKNMSRSGSGGYWAMIDTKRDIYNVGGKHLHSDRETAEQSVTNGFDILGNGIKFRDTNGYWNYSTDKILYWAFAETPLKYSNAR